MRVLQARQDRALARDALAQALIHPLGAWQLQRRGALHHAVGTLGHPHRAHAAFGQQSRQLPWTDPITGLLAPHRGERLRGEVGHCGRRTGRIGKAGGIGLSEQIDEHRAQMLVFVSQSFQPRGALGTLELQTPLEQLVQAMPVGNGQRGMNGHRRSAPSHWQRRICRSRPDMNLALERNGQKQAGALSVSA